MLFQTGGIMTDNDLRLRAGILATTDADLGYFVRYSDRWDEFGVSLSMRQIFAGDKEESVPSDVFDPFTESSSQFNSTVSYRIPEWDTSFSFSASYTRNGGSDSWSFGPQASVILYDENNVNVNWNTSITQSSRELLAITRLSLSYRTDNWFYRAQSIYRYSDRSSAGVGDKTTGPEGNVAVTWTDKDLWEDDLSIGLSASRELNADLFNANTIYQNDYGSLEAQYDRSIDTETTDNYTGSFDFNLVGAESGISIGGRDAASSGVMVSLHGNASMENPFEVHINNNFEADIVPGETIFLPLNAFNSHQVSLVGVGAEFIEIKGGIQEVALYPGTIASAEFEANRVMPTFGQAVFGNGEPIANARIEGGGVLGIAVTDDNGFFQMEISQPGTYLLRSVNMQDCPFEIADMPEDEFYLDLGIVRCGEEQFADLGALEES